MEVEGIEPLIRRSALPRSLPVSRKVLDSDTCKINKRGSNSLGLQRMSQGIRSERGGIERQRESDVVPQNNSVADDSCLGESAANKNNTKQVETAQNASATGVLLKLYRKRTNSGI